jgi:hypothetical protein
MSGSWMPQNYGLATPSSSPARLERQETWPVGFDAAFDYRDGPNAPQALLELVKGTYTGKTVVRLGT